MTPLAYQEPRQHPVRAERLRQKMLLTELAKRCEISAPLLSMIEVAHHVPKPITQQRIAAELGVPVDALWPELWERT